MKCPPIPQFSLDFLLRSKTYLKTSASIANREFPLSNLIEDVVRVFYTHYISTSYKLHCCTVVYTSARCLAHHVTQYMHCFMGFVVHSIDACNVGPPPV